MTLQEMEKREAELLAGQKAKTSGFITTLTERANAAEGDEKARLLGLVDLHTQRLAELEKEDPKANAAESFARWQEREAKMKLPEVPKIP